MMRSRNVCFRKLNRPLRCVAKVFYPHCASKGVNLNTFLSNFLPQLNLMSNQLIDLNVERVTFSKPKV